MPSLQEGMGVRASFKNEPNFPNAVQPGRNHLRPGNLPKRASVLFEVASILRGSISTGARLLLVVGAIYGIHLIEYARTSAPANMKADEHLSPQPSQAAPTVPKPSPVVGEVKAANTVRAVSSMARQQIPAPVPRSRASSAPHYSPVRYEATRKRLLGGCTGELELTGSVLHFRCADQADLIVPVATIAKVHKDGVELKSGEKYHFTIANRTRGEVEAIFLSWLSRVQQS